MSALTLAASMVAMTSVLFHGAIHDDGYRAVTGQILTVTVALDRTRGFTLILAPLVQPCWSGYESGSDSVTTTSTYCLTMQHMGPVEPAGSLGTQGKEYERQAIMMVGDRDPRRQNEGRSRGQGQDRSVGWKVGEGRREVQDCALRVRRSDNFNE